MKTKLAQAVILSSVLVLQPLFSASSVAHAKRKPAKAYSFIAEGGKASQGECDGEWKLPRLKRLKEYAKTNAYVGSELQESELKGKTNDEMWKHFFKNKPACNVVLERTPSSVQDPVLRNTKPDIPEEEPEDTPEQGTSAATGTPAE